MIRLVLVAGAVLGPPWVVGGSPGGWFAGPVARADPERMRLDPGERERLRGELREQPWYRGHGHHPDFPPSPPPMGEMVPGGPVDGPRVGFGARIRRGDEAGPPGPWPGMRLSPDERRELRRQLRENPPGRWRDEGPARHEGP